MGFQTVKTKVTLSRENMISLLVDRLEIQVSGSNEESFVIFPQKMQQMTTLGNSKDRFHSITVRAKPANEESRSFPGVLSVETHDGQEYTGELSFEVYPNDVWSE